MARTDIKINGSTNRYLSSSCTSISALSVCVCVCMHVCMCVCEGIINANVQQPVLQNMAITNKIHTGNKCGPYMFTVCEMNKKN